MAQQFQGQNDGLCLRYPDNLGLHREISYETAVSMLLRGVQLSQAVPYVWGYVDKPLEGQVMIVFLQQPQAPFPTDGIRYQEQEVKFTIPLSNIRELEIQEVKYGFIPGSTDTNAWRVRRRYRLQKGGHPQLVLVHYTRGPVAPILQNLINQPVRPYPLPQVTNPAVFVMGEKAGQKIYPQGAGPTHTSAAPMPPPGMPINFSQQQAMVAQQNSAMEAMERRRERERARERSASSANVSVLGQRVDDEDSGDETEFISTRTLASTRYRRNHELMNEVFNYAAFGDKSLPPRAGPYSNFNPTELEDKVAKLQAEVDALQAKAAERTARHQHANQNSFTV
ncbi:hypothetical protein BDN72DRAFT_868414 [Pluteus cervinus]|uniref:Uncharacterized protein n=1 Tax=Pluteus cervinus TaxID=181527 RepID=A0ACD3BAS3_9AGAR|nr:hypothetical protein BDN72DRAFT_868414 [Pluteus cervinus]